MQLVPRDGLADTQVERAASVGQPSGCRRTSAASGEPRYPLPAEVDSYKSYNYPKESGWIGMANPFAAEIELLVLRLLRDAPAGMYGLELIRASNDKVKRGTVYVTLGRLESKGFVTSRTVHNAKHAGLPRPVYTLTALGQRMLDAADLMHLPLVRAQ